VRLEPDEGKLSRPVLRGLGRSNPARLPDQTLDQMEHNHCPTVHRIVVINTNRSYQFQPQRAVVLSLGAQHVDFAQLVKST
jgi:hypothetical protein